MKPTPAHYAYSRKVVQVMAPWLALGVGLESLGAAGMAVHNRPLGAAMLIGAVFMWIGIWRMFAWRRAHPFETAGADRETR